MGRVVEVEAGVRVECTVDNQGHEGRGTSLAVVEERWVAVVGRYDEPDRQQAHDCQDQHYLKAPAL